MILWSCSVAGEESGRFLLKELKSIFTEGKHFEEENGKGVAVLFIDCFERWSTSGFTD